MMATSNQTYDVKSNERTDDVGMTGFNNETGELVIFLPINPSTAVLAHEFKHGFQFETGEISADREGEDRRSGRL